MKKVIVPNGKCVIHNLTVGFLDSSLCGVETTIRANGVVCNDGKFEQFEIREEDTDLKTFFEVHKAWTVYAYGSVHIFDELNYVDMYIAPINFDKYKSVFPALNELQLPLESYLSKEYDQMRESFALNDWSCRNDIC